MKIGTIRSTDIARCPIHSFSVEHYNEDGSCKPHAGDNGVCRHCGQPIRFRVTGFSGWSRWEHVGSRRVSCEQPPPPVAEP